MLVGPFCSCFSKSKIFDVRNSASVCVRDHMCTVLQIVISYQVAHISIESNHLKWSFSCQDRSFPLNKVLHLSTWIIKDVGNSALVVGLPSNQYIRQRHLGSSPYTEVSYNFSSSYKFGFAQLCVWVSGYLETLCWLFAYIG